MLSLIFLTRQSEFVVRTNCTLELTDDRSTITFETTKTHVLVSATSGLAVSEHESLEGASRKRLQI